MKEVTGMTKARLIFIAVLMLVVAQSMFAARYGFCFGGRVGFFEGGG
jgi:hypothetical protein